MRTKLHESQPDPASASTFVSVSSHQFAAGGNLHGGPIPHMGFFNSQPNSVEFGILPRSEADFSNPNYQLPDPADLSEDYNLLLDDFDLCGIRH
jgi:hypothetical protein